MALKAWAALALVAMSVTPHLARADAPRVHPFAELSASFGPVAGKMIYKGPYYTGQGAQTVGGGEKTQSFEGLAFVPSLALGVAVGGWVFGARVTGVDVPRFARAPSIYEDGAEQPIAKDELAAGSYAAFARWYVARPDGGTWVETSAGACNSDVVTSSETLIAYPNGYGPADGDAFTSTWGPEISLSAGYAIGDLPWQWGPVVRLSGADMWSAHGRVLMGGATLGVGVAWR